MKKFRRGQFSSLASPTRGESPSWTVACACWGGFEVFFKAVVAEHRWIPPLFGPGIVCFSSDLTLPKLLQLLCFLEVVFPGPLGFVLPRSPS